MRGNNMKNFTLFPKTSGYKQQFDLLNNEVCQEQRTNALKYQKRSLVGKLGFVLFGVGLYPLFIFRNNDWLIIIATIGMVMAAIGSLFARCPHCGSLQPGRVYGLSFSGNSLFTSYSKGIWPFASRCAKCEYYLSQRKLEKDREILIRNHTKDSSI